MRDELFDKINEAPKNFKESEDKYVDLKKLIKQIDSKMKEVVQKQQNEYVGAMKEFMNEVREDMNNKIKELEEAKSNQEKNNNIKNIKAERDFFRSEAMRLNDLCKGS